MNTEKVETGQDDVLVVIVTSSFVTLVRYRGHVFVRIGPRKDIAFGEEEVTIFLTLLVVQFT